MMMVVVVVVVEREAERSCLPGSTENIEVVLEIRQTFFEFLTEVYSTHV